jgi:Mn-dependent DtxR family transcriptional regulator
MATPSMEDYLERIYQLMQEKGYARVVDIASLLNVQSPSVTRMIQKLAEENFLEYEKYRGIVLTPKGEQLGKSIKRRHKALSEFLRLAGVEDENTIWKDVEGIEHHVSPATMDAIRTLVHFFEENPKFYEELREFRARQHAARHRDAHAPSGGDGDGSAASGSAAALSPTS